MSTTLLTPGEYTTTRPFRVRCAMSSFDVALGSVIKIVQVCDRWGLKYLVEFGPRLVDWYHAGNVHSWIDGSATEEGF